MAASSTPKRRVFLRELPDPDHVQRAVSTLLAIPGVLSVFLGAPTRKGRRYVHGYALCVRVALKSNGQGLPDFVPIPQEIEGIPTDVEAIGEPTVQAVSAGQDAGAVPCTPGDRRTPGVLTAVTGGGEALLSGHASLPFRGGAIERVYDGGDAPVLIGQARGTLRAGRIGPREDWARADLVAVIDAVHPVPGAPPPFVRVLARQGGVLRHLSRAGGLRRGRVISTGAIVDIPLRLPDGSINTYSGVYELEPINAPTFSVPGDSGSLVFDALGRAVGVVVGGSASHHRSYVLAVAVEPPFFSG